MHAEDVERVVIFQSVFNGGDEEVADRADQKAQHNRTHRSGVTGSRCHRNKTSDSTRHHAEQSGLTLGDPFREQPREGCSRSGDKGVHHRENRTAIGFQIGAGIEAEPTHPQQRGTDHGHGQRVWRHQFTAIANALAEHDRTDETGNTGIDVHNRAASEVERTPLIGQTSIGHHRIKLGLCCSLGGCIRTGVHESLGSLRNRIGAGPIPNHVRDREVDEGHPQRHKNQHRREPDAFGKGTDDQSRGDAGKGHLEGDINQLGDHHTIGEGGDNRIRRNALQEQLVETADKIADRIAGKGQRIPVNHPNQGDQSHNRENLAQNRQHVFGADKTAVKQSKTRNGHQQNQNGRNQHPGRVAFIGDRSGSGIGSKSRHAHECQTGSGKGTWKESAKFHDVHPCV